MTKPDPIIEALERIIIEPATIRAEAAEEKVKEQTILLAILDCDDPAKAAAARIAQLEAKNAELAAQLAVVKPLFDWLVNRLNPEYMQGDVLEKYNQAVDTMNNFPAEAEKLVRLVKLVNEIRLNEDYGVVDLDAFNELIGIARERRDK